MRYLAHFGIPGMKWGIRRPIGPDGLIEKSGRRSKVTVQTKKQNSMDSSKEDQNVPKTSGKPSSDHEISRMLKSVPLSEMSNEQLRAFNTRFQLEKQYNELNKKKMSAGKKFVDTLIKGVGDNLTQYAVKETTKVLTDNLDKIIKKAR